MSNNLLLPEQLAEDSTGWAVWLRMHVMGSSKGSFVGKQLTTPHTSVVCLVSLGHTYNSHGEEGFVEVLRRVVCKSVSPAGFAE